MKNDIYLDELLNQFSTTNRVNFYPDKVGQIGKSFMEDFMEKHKIQNQVDYTSLIEELEKLNLISPSIKIDSDKNNHYREITKYGKEVLNKGGWKNYLCNAKLHKTYKIVISVSSIILAACGVFVSFLQYCNNTDYTPTLEKLRKQDSILQERELKYFEEQSAIHKNIFLKIDTCK